MLRKLEKGIQDYNVYGGKIYKNKYFPIYECVKCGTRYPEINKKIMCNGKQITACPYCRGSKRTPSALKDFLVKRGYNETLSAGAIASTYFLKGMQSNWDKQTQQDIRDFEREVI
jgi:excinuclease UvrABC ATPase subunit